MEWDGERCNHSVGKDWKRRSPSPVTEYEGRDKGDSAFGVTDTAGNVWEACLTAFKTGKLDPDGGDIRVMRGGSWSNREADYFRVAYRHWYYPGYGFSAVGFRLGRS